jgi:hypothetical protein
MRSPFLQKIWLSMASLAFLAVFFTPGAIAEDTLPKPVEQALELMTGLGPVKSIKGERYQEEKDSESIVLETEFSTVYFGIADSDQVIRSISRIATGGKRVSLKWDKERAEPVARGYVDKLFAKEITGPPIRTQKEDIIENRELWSVSWLRRVDGIIVRDDFVTVEFNETEGLFGFAYSWDTVVPAFDLKTVIRKEDALREGRVFAKRIMKADSVYFQVYSLGRVQQCELMIVSPNAELWDAARADKRSRSTGKPPARLAWVIDYNVLAEPAKIKGNYVPAVGFSVFLDAVSGEFLGGML